MKTNELISVLYYNGTYYVTPCVQDSVCWHDGLPLIKVSANNIQELAHAIEQAKNLSFKDSTKTLDQSKFWDRKVDINSQKVTIDNEAQIKWSISWSDENVVVTPQEHAEKFKGIFSWKPISSKETIFDNSITLEKIAETIKNETFN